MNTLLQWYRSGQDPERRLPLLSTFLGHVYVADTFWYLSACPELMREASHAWSDVGRESHETHYEPRLFA